MIEKIFKTSDIEVTYLYKKATSDKRHLVVVFTGFSEEYSFLNVGKAFKCNVIWIKDEFEGTECYYLGKNGELNFAKAVNTLIEKTLFELSLNKKQCSLLGGSKGAFSALFFGIKYQYNNIIASAPTTKIGSRMVKMHPNIAKFMMGSKEPLEYDNLLYSQIKSDVNLKKNIYLFVSEDDSCYQDHQKHLIQLLRTYDNFNLIMVNSDLVFRYNRVTAYSVPLIIMCITATIENIPLKFGYLEAGCKSKGIDLKNNSQGKSISILDQIRMDQDTLLLKGAAFFPNISINGVLYQKKLILKNDKKFYEYALDIVKDDMFSVRFFDNNFIDYSSAGFANSSKEIISLSEIDCGIYQLYTSVKVGENKEDQQPMKFDSILDSKFINLEFEYRLWSKDEYVFLSKRKLLESFNAPKEIFKLSELKVEGAKIFIRGIYAISGVELDLWGDANYYLVLSNNISTVSYRLGMEHNDILNNELGAGFGLYHKSCFATFKHQGINLAELIDGEYNIYVVLSYKGTLFHKKLKQVLSIKNTDLCLI